MPATTEFGQEFIGAHFNDARLNQRILKIADSLGKNCRESIPAAATTRAEMEATYRFMDNQNVTPAKILEPHTRAAQARMRECPVVLLVNDTTEIEVTRPTQQVDGAGPLEHESRRGGYLHPTLAVTESGVPLGIVRYEHWTREAIHTNRSAADRRKACRRRPIEEKESYRWVQAVRAGRETAAACPNTECIMVSDSESDIFEVLAEPRVLSTGKMLGILVRATADRNIETSEEIGKLYAQIRQTPCRFSLKIEVSARKAKTNVATTSKRKCSRDARQAELEVRAGRVTICSPRNGPKRPSVEYNVVLVEEVSPPADQPAIQWVLITSLPIDTDGDIERVVQCYRQRWQIECYFRVLKSGCRIQERYFETYERLENCLAIYMVIAWKIMYLCHLGRECPNLPCDLVFSESQWQSVYLVVKKGPLPDQPPGLNEMIRMIATLGGYVPRKSTQPGTQTLWIGFQKVCDYALAWDTFGPKSRRKT